MTDHPPVLAWMRRVRKTVACALIATLTLPAHLPAWAANHPWSGLADVNTINYVVNVDWDFDNPPRQALDAAQTLDRAYITQVLRNFAQAKFAMTEGRHRVGTVYVYRNRLFGDNVDIRLINTMGRSMAEVAGWSRRNATSYNHLAFEGRPESLFDMGRVIAHELGHYTYGLYDEYRDEQTPLNPAARGMPANVDTPRPTIMNNHLQFLALSTPADYADPAQRQTAQARVYATRPDATGGSAWETLTRRPEQDPEAVRGQRTFFEAFAGVNPATLRLTQPTAGFDAALNIIFVPSPVFRDVIVIDRTLPLDRYQQLIQAARTLVAQAPAESQFGLVVNPPVGGDASVPLTQATEQGKRSIISILDNLLPQAGAFDANTAVGLAIALANRSRQPGDISTMHLLTAAEQAVPAEVQNSLRNAQVVSNILGISGGDQVQRRALRAAARKASVSGQAVNLTQLAQGTGGVYHSARDGSEAAKDLVRGVKEVHSQVYAALKIDGSAALAAGSRFESVVKVASGATDGTVVVDVAFDPADAASVTTSLVAPNGAVYTPNNLPAGVTFESHASEGIVAYQIDTDAANRVGDWKVVVSASRALSDGIGIEVWSDAQVALTGEAVGGTAGSIVKPFLRVRLGGEKSIRAAVVTADIYNEDGTLALGGVALRDDGVAPDDRAGDGTYVADLSGKLPGGEYFAIVRASTTADSRIAALGALIKGALNEQSPVEALTRMTEITFSLDGGAPGVPLALGGSDPPAPEEDASGGGGCVASPTGRDAGLLLLVLAALAGWGLRRRPPAARW